MKTNTAAKIFSAFMMAQALLGAGALAGVLMKEGAAASPQVDAYCVNALTGNPCADSGREIAGVLAEAPRG